MARMVSISRLILLGVALLAAAAAPAPVTAEDGAAAAVARGEVRLRKLHLVRPDLIPYPIVYEVLC